MYRLHPIKKHEIGYTYTKLCNFITIFKRKVLNILLTLYGTIFEVYTTLNKKISKILTYHDRTIQSIDKREHIHTKKQHQLHESN